MEMKPIHYSLHKVVNNAISEIEHIKEDATDEQKETLKANKNRINPYLATQCIYGYMFGLSFSSECISFTPKTVCFALMQSERDILNTYKMLTVSGGDASKNAVLKPRDLYLEGKTMTWLEAILPCFSIKERSQIIEYIVGDSESHGIDEVLITKLENSL